MSLRNHKGYLIIEESLIIRFVLPLILSANDEIVCPSLSMRNLRDNVLVFSNRDWFVYLIVLMLHPLLWFENPMVLFEYASITEH